MSAPDDVALAAGVRARDEGAVARLIERVWAPGHRVALAVTGDAALADDVMQEATVAAVASVHRWRPERARLETWVLGVVRRHALAKQRAARRRVRHEAAATPPREVADPARAAQHDDEVERVRRELGALGAPQREALTLRYVEGLSLAEAGAVLGYPEGTVSSRVRLGLEALRRGLVRPASAMVPLEELLRRALICEAPPAPAASEVVQRAAALALRARWLVGAALLATAAALVAGVALVVATPPAPAPATVVDARQVDEPAPVTSTAAPEAATDSAATPTPLADPAAPSRVPAPASALARSRGPEPEVATPIPTAPALRVVDGAGRPVAGAQVFALDGHEHPRPVDLGDPFDKPRTTGPDGLFPADPDAAGYLVRRGLDRAWLDTPEVWPSWTTDVRLLTPDEPRPGLTVVTGRLLTPAGPLRDARVRAHVSEGPTEFEGWFPTDGEGRFVVRDLPPRPWTLWVQPEGWAQGSVQLDAKPGTQTVELRLTPACLLQGELVTGADDPRLFVWSDDPRRWDMGTDVEGRYQFTDLAPGSYWVEAELPGLVGRRVRVDVGERVTRGPVLRLDDGVTVTGRLAEGPHRRVGLIPVDVEPLRRLEDWGTTTDAAGRFTVRNVLPGRHRLAVTSHVPWGSEHVEVAKVEVAGQDLDLGDVAVGPAPDVKDVLVGGLVRDDAGAPVAGAEVHILLPFSSTNAITGPDGRFLLGCGVTAGKHALWARTPDGRVTAALQHVDVGPDGLDATLVVAPGGTIVGRVVASEARRNADLLCVEAHPASDLHAKREWSRFQATPRSDDGSFRLAGLPPGRTRVTLLSQGRERWVDVRAGATVDVGELDLRAEVATIEVRLRDVADDRGRVALRWRDGAGAEVSTGERLHSGAARLEWVQVGSVELLVERWADGKRRTWTFPLDVPLAGLRLEVDPVAGTVLPQ